MTMTDECQEMNDASPTLQTGHDHRFPADGIKRVRQRGLGKASGEPPRKNSAKVDAGHANPSQGSKASSPKARHAEMSGSGLWRNKHLEVS